MSRSGVSNVREKEKLFHAQEDTFRESVERERRAEVLHHAPAGTYAEGAARAGPTVSTSHAAHSGAHPAAAEAERPAGKP
eukprot:CAMPEP_0176253182 /NCGR_PEP_ID=MMETSP0121_2-20121125/35884_1 /TAXON_ID=160619 /ORGANISM="Kryptoperidinium foliaceum, Strain CCMP 1326" /LENGTH=79 /DNA_ID=CAMNT_0017592951 /DNA_START=52 /DNA_END=288 /DNA_ORIENTATION=-